MPPLPGLGFFLVVRFPAGFAAGKGEYNAPGSGLGGTTWPYLSSDHHPRDV